ncbi:hypothetical protein, partial [Acinetobacter baumannii]|uniref:hypothetical protein n=1 Tax=Acinetobacter baumannii TaxID=470 RepID=UPI0038CD279B
MVRPVEPINRYSLRHSRSYQIGYLYSADSVNGQMGHSSQINDRWFVNANYSYTDAQIEKDQDLAKGARLSNVPKH